MTAVLLIEVQLQGLAFVALQVMDFTVNHYPVWHAHHCNEEHLSMEDVPIRGLVLRRRALRDGRNIPPAQRQHRTFRNI